MLLQALLVGQNNCDLCAVDLGGLPKRLGDSCFPSCEV